MCAAGSKARARGQAMRLRPESIRIRDTLIAALLSGMVLTAIAVAVDYTVHHAVRESAWHDAERVTRQVGETLRDGRPDRLPSTGMVPYIQVVDARGAVIAASSAAARIGA